MPETPHSRRRADVAKKAATALSLRAQGLTFEEIGAALGIHKSNAWRRVVDEMAKAAKKSEAYANDILSKELATLDILLDKCMDAVETGDLDAVPKAIRILERRSRYLGLDKPTEFKGEINTTSTFLTKEQVLEKIMEKVNQSKSKTKKG